MGGLEMLLAEFDEPEGAEDLQQPFKDLALALKDLPIPWNRRALRALLDLRRLVARAH